LAGIAISTAGVLLLVLAVYALLKWETTFSFLWYVVSASFLFIVMILSIGILSVGTRLLAYESSRPLSLEDVKKRVTKSSNDCRCSIRPSVICFSGMDGSGKTTQLTKLSKCLEKRGLKYKYVRLRWAAFISFPFLAFCRMLKYTRRRVIRGTVFLEHRFYRNSAIAKTWTWLFCVDMLMFWIYRFKIPLMMGYHVLCDRFVYDAMVDVMCDTRQPELHSSLAGRLLLSLVPNDSLTLFFDLDEQQAFKRKTDIPSINYLAQRRKLFSQLAFLLKIPLLDAGRSPAELQKEIIDRFISHYPFWWVTSSDLDSSFVL
jgi:dTMP kinase